MGDTAPAPGRRPGITPAAFAAKARTLGLRIAAETKVEVRRLKERGGGRRGGRWRRFFFFPLARLNLATSSSPPPPLLLQLGVLRTQWWVILLCAIFQYVHGIFTQLAYRVHHPAPQPLPDLGFKALPVRVEKKKGGRERGLAFAHQACVLRPPPSRSLSTRRAPRAPSIRHLTLLSLAFFPF